MPSNTGRLPPHYNNKILIYSPHTFAAACTKTQNNEMKPPKQNEQNNRNAPNKGNETELQRKAKPVTFIESYNHKQPHLTKGPFRLTRVLFRLAEVLLGLNKVLLRLTRVLFSPIGVLFNVLLVSVILFHLAHFGCLGMQFRFIGFGVSTCPL